MSADEPIETIAEAIVFAHDVEAGVASTSTAAAELESVATLVTAALIRTATVPERLQARLAAAGREFCAERRSSAVRRGFTVVKAERPARGRRPNGAVAFLLGVAAVALVWVAVDLTERAPKPAPVSEQRAGLLGDPSARQLAWAAGPSPLSGQIEGSVVWSDTRQEGYLSFKGLPPLDRDYRFQLWIVDGERPGSDPVDGGLFAIDDAKTESVVPIQPHLPIGKAAAFVVTVENKRGVVVSKQEHVVAVAGL